MTEEERTLVSPIPKTAEAARAPFTGAASPVVTPVKPTTPQSIFSQVSTANARQSPLVKKLAERTQSTKDILSPWMRLLLHGEIDSKKTVTASRFSSPENTRIILTRGEDQLLPIKSLGIQYVKVENASEFIEAMAYCDTIWPDWAKLPEPYLIIDDISKGKDMVLKDNETFTSGTGEVREHKDPRKMHVAALKEMDSVFTTLNRKPIHITLVALSKIRENAITQEESIFPDLPPAMSNLIMSDYSYIYYINKKKPNNACLLTGKDFESITEYDENQKKNVTFQRFMFARHKLPVELEGKGIIRPYEPLDLRAIWERIKKGEPAKVGT
jgi:hypothetical protein